jgi:hypothetical protein
VELTNVESAEFNHCSFSDCLFHNQPKEDWKEIGGVIWTNNLDTPVKLNASVFSNCGEYSQNGHYSSSQIANANVSAVDCVFNRCYGSHLGNRGFATEPDSKNRLFCKVSMNKNNKTKECRNATFCGNGDVGRTQGSELESIEKSSESLDIFDLLRSPHKAGDEIKKIIRIAQQKQAR